MIAHLLFVAFARGKAYSVLRRMQNLAEGHNQSRRHSLYRLAITLSAAIARYLAQYAEGTAIAPVYPQP